MKSLRTAYLNNGEVIDALEYIESIHGREVYCIDRSCKAPVIYVSGTETKSPYFKTSGKHNSKHNHDCGFFRTLDFMESLQKIEDYQKELIGTGFKESIIRLNFNKMDPEYISKSTERAAEDKSRAEERVKVKPDSSTPQTVTSLKSVYKLFISNDLDILSSIIISVKGFKIPISELILGQKSLHHKLWNDELIPRMPYFVYGKIEFAVKREKVMYINFEKIDDTKITVVLFDKYFKYFSYEPESLIGKDVIVWGDVRKNSFRDVHSTEVIIKSDKYIEFIN